MVEINGLYLFKNYINDQYHDYLVNFIKSQQWDNILKRRTQQYGYLYDYSRSSKPQSTKPMTQELITLKNYIENIDGMNGAIFDQCIINEYEPGQGISPHTDHTTQFGPIVVTLSLNSPCNFQFIKGEQIINYHLEPKELCIMTTEVRYKWKHAIPKTKSDRTGTRYSITFRSIM